MDLANIIQNSLEGFVSGPLTNTQSSAMHSASETIIIKPGDQRFTIPITTSDSGATTIQLPSTTDKEQSLILPANFNTNGGPLLCQLDDNSYILIEGLDAITTNTTTSPTKTVTATTVTSPSSTVKPTGTSSVTIKPSVYGTETGQMTPTMSTSSVVKKATPPQTVTLKSPTITTQPETTQSTTRPTFLIMSNSPIVSKTGSIPTTKDSSSLVKSTTCTTSSAKPFTNIITPTSQNHTPFKYVLVPQPNSVQTPAPITFRATNSGMKTITLNPTSGSTISLPIGTSLIPTKLVNKPIPGKPGSTTIIPPSKINLNVPPIHSNVVQKMLSQIGVSETQSKITCKPYGDEITSSENESDEKDLAVIEQPASPKLFDLTDDESSSSGPTKTLKTYSKFSSPATVKPTSKPNIIRLQSPPLITPTASSLTKEVNKSLNIKQLGQSLVAKTSAPLSTLGLPMQTIIPGKSSLTIIPNRKRKVDPKVSAESIIKKKKEEESLIVSSNNEGKTVGSTDGCLIREVIASRNIQSSDQAIISTAIHELKKLFAKREILLKQLNSSCVALGKVEYKLTIAGAPVNTQEMYNRITTFEKQYETDLKRLDWAISAMHKLYSELAPKDEMRSTEDILKDLIGPANGIPEDPKAKYEKFNVTPPSVKKVGSPKSKVRSPKRPAKTFYYQGEKGCPTVPLEERKVPDKPDPSDGKFHCELCSKIFLKQISLAKHLEFDHPVSLELEKKLDSKRSPKLPHACKDCDKSFHSNIMLLIHRSDEHDSSDSYEIGRESRTISDKRSKSCIFSDANMKSPSEDESKPTKNTQMTTRNARANRRVKKPVRRTRATTNNNKPKPKITENLDFLIDSDEAETGSPNPNLRSNWHENDLFDPDIPIECTFDNPIIPLKPLSEEVIAAYTYSSRR